MIARGLTAIPGCCSGLRLPKIYYTGMESGTAEVGDWWFSMRRDATHIRSTILMVCHRLLTCPLYVDNVSVSRGARA